MRPTKCRFCGQLLVVATRDQHERNCSERVHDTGTRFLEELEELGSLLGKECLCAKHWTLDLS